MSAPPEELTPALRAFAAKTKDAAFALYTNIHACVFLNGVPEMQCAVAQNLFALGGMIEMLISSISQAPASVPSPSFKLSAQDVETLQRCMTLCGPVLDAVDAGVKVADEYVNPNSTLSLEKGVHRLGAFPAGGVEEQRIVQTCLHEVIRLGMKVRSHCLEKQASLNDVEAGESLRLQTALKHADLNKSITAMSVGQKIHFIPQVLESAFPRSIIQVDAIPPPPYRRTDYIQSLAYSFPAGSNVGPLQNTMMEAATRAEEAKKDAQATPASTRESTPAMDGSFVDVSAPTSGAQQATDTSNPSDEKGKRRADDTTEETETTPVPPVPNSTNTNIPQPLKLGPFERLDTYIMYPTVSSFGDSVSWTMKIELLHLHESLLQVYLQRSNADAITAAMSELPPNQIGPLQARIRQRQGRLVFVQHSEPVEMGSPMGPLHAKRVIFGLVTTQPPEREQESLFGGFGKTGLFSNPGNNNNIGNNLFQTNASAQQSPFSRPNSGLFGPPQPAPQPSFKSAKDYENYLRERGEECFGVEEDASHLIQRYMSITTENRYSRPGQDHSFEELRVEDYAAGRDKPMKINPFLYSWENPIRTEPPKDERPFGGQYTNPKPRVGLFGLPAQTSASASSQPQQHSCWAPLFGTAAASNRQQPPSGSPFGGFGSSSQTQPQAGRLFGNLGSQRPASGGLFGNPSPWNQQQQPSSEGLFGGFGSSSQQQRPAGGLFGNLGQQQQQNQPSGGLFGGGFGSPTPQRPSGGLFGNLGSPSQEHQQQQPSGGLFGATAASSSPKPEQKQAAENPFGNMASSNTQPTQPSSGPFGKSPSDSPQQGQKKPSGGLYSNLASPMSHPIKPASPGLQQQQPQQSSNNIFGKPASPQPQPEQKPPTGGLFGKSSSPSQPQQPLPSLFGKKPESPPVSLFGQPSRSTPTQPTGSLFGASPTTNPPPTSASLFGTRQPSPGALFGKTTQPQHFVNPLSRSGQGLFVASSTPAKPEASASSTTNAAPRSLFSFPPTTTATTSLASPSLFGTTKAANTPPTALNCKKCKTSLVFHSAAEQFAALCDACKGDENTTCWLCERKIGADKAAAEVKMEGKKETEEAPGSGKGKAKVEAEVKKEEDDDKDEDKKDDSTSTPQRQSGFAFAKYKSERAVSPFATLGDGAKTSPSGFSFGSSATASVKKEKEDDEKDGEKEKEKEVKKE